MNEDYYEWTICQIMAERDCMWDEAEQIYMQESYAGLYD